MRAKSLLVPACLALTLTACSHHGGAASNHYVLFGDHTVVVKSDDKPDARIGESGDLHIGEDAVEVDASQRALLTRYYRKATQVRDDEIASGREGVTFSMHAMNSTFGNLLAGTPEKIDQDVNARSKTVEATGPRLCGDLGQLKAAQDDLASRLPTFRPYAVLGNEIDYFGGHLECDETGAPEPPQPPVTPQPPKPPAPPHGSAATGTA